MSDSDPLALFSYVAEHLNSFDLAYLHLIEPRVDGSITTHPEHSAVASQQLRPIFKGKLISAGGFEADTAEAAIESGLLDAVSFGRHFVSNPDLVRRMRDQLALNPYDRDTFYTFDARGYTDYPAYDANLSA